MSWLIDNATTLTILFALVAAALAMIWRSTGQNKYLGYAAGAVALIGLIWLLAWLVPTDAKLLRKNVDAMADAVVAGNVEDLFKHISKDFVYEFGGTKMTRDQLNAAAQLSIKRGQVGSVNISQFRVDKVSRADKSATVSFKVTAFDTKGTILGAFDTKAGFVLEGEDWKLKTVDFYKTGVNTNEKIGIPGQ